MPTRRAVGQAGAPAPRGLSGREAGPVLNPATAEEIAQAPDSSAADVDRAVQAARKAFEGWANATPGERSLALLRLADRLEEHADELAELESANAGKPIQ